MAELGSPPASMFDAPPPMAQEASGVSPQQLPRSLGGGGGGGGGVRRPSTRPFGSASRDIGDAWEGDSFGGGEAEGAGDSSAADLFASSSSVVVPEEDIFGAAAGGSAERADGGWQAEQRQHESAAGIEAAPFGSPPQQGDTFGGGDDAFGGNGGEEDQSWWQQSDAGNGETAAVSPPMDTSAGTAPIVTGEEGGSVAVDSSEGFGGAREGTPEASPLPGTPPEETHEEPEEAGSSRPAFPQARGEEEDLGAPPADMFGPPPPTAVAHFAQPEVKAQQKGGPPPNRSPRAGATPAAAEAGPPRALSRYGGAKIDVGDLEGVAAGGPPAGVGIEAGGASSSSGTPAVAAGTWAASRAASPGWEKQPSPPLELGVFGEPTPAEAFASETTAAAAAAADLFGASGGGDAAVGEGGPGEGNAGYQGWGMCAADAPGGSDSGAPSFAPRAPPPLPTGAPPSPRSSFVANDGHASLTIAALASVGVPPSTPPRLFATRSSSWAAQDKARAEDQAQGFQQGAGGVFAKRDHPPSRSASPDRPEPTAEDNDEPCQENSGSMMPSTPPPLGAGEAAAAAAAELTRSPVSPQATSPVSPGAASPADRHRGGDGGGTKPARYSQAHQPPFSTIPESLDAQTLVAQSPPRLRGAPADHRSEDESAAAATPSEGGGRVGPGSTLSTPFGAWSRGSGATPTPGVGEGFPSSEDGEVLDESPKIPSPPSATAAAAAVPGKDIAAAEVPPSGSSKAEPASVAVPEGVSVEGGVGGGAHNAAFALPPPPAGGAAPAAPAGITGAVAETGDGEEEAETISEEASRAVEGKEDERPRPASPQAAVDDPAAAAAASLAPGEAVQKMDADSDEVDGWGGDDDDWGLDDEGGDANTGGAGDLGSSPAEGTAAGTVAASAGSPGVDDAGGREDGLLPCRRDSETNLFGSEISEGDVSWGGGGGGGDERGPEDDDDEIETGSGIDTEESSTDADKSNEASIAETTANDFFAVRSYLYYLLGSIYFQICR